jgi:hypothetical protein
MQLGDDLLTLSRTQRLKEHLPARLPHTFPVHALPFDIPLTRHAGLRPIQADQLGLPPLGVPPAQQLSGPLPHASPRVGTRGLHDRHATRRR